MKLCIKITVCLLIALCLGIVSALWAINSPPGENYNVTSGAWRTNLAIGSSQAGMYIRALVARTGQTFRNGRNRNGYKPCVVVG